MVCETSGERVVVVPGHFDGLRRMLVLEVVDGRKLDRGGRALGRRRGRAERRRRAHGRGGRVRARAARFQVLRRPGIVAEGLPADGARYLRVSFQTCRPPRLEAGVVRVVANAWSEPPTYRAAARIVSWPGLRRARFVKPCQLRL